MRSERKRMRVMAEHLRLCPRHLTPLHCPGDDVSWIGTDEELQELFRCYDRVERFWPRQYQSALSCDTHRTQRLYCEHCFEDECQRTPLPAAVRDWPEWDRLHALMRLVQWKNPHEGPCEEARGGRHRMDTGSGNAG